MNSDMAHWPVTLSDPTLVKTQALINGQWHQANDEGLFSVMNPATGEVIARVANCGTREAEGAVDAAHNAFAGWRQVPVKQRAALIRTWYQLVLEHQDDLAKILTLEQGKILAEAKGEILYGASYLEWFAEEAKRICGDVISAPTNDKRIMSIKSPVGVVSCITPWNFPNAMLARKIAPALAAGCTVVCKPANETPLSALALGELALRAGMPPGVINILCGKTEEIGEVLTTHPGVRKVSFTGSTAVGKQLLKQCADTVKRTSMELGGNAPFIVFEDANLDKAIDGAIASKLRNSGQTCICPNRFLVHEDLYDDFVQRLAERFEAIQVGKGYDDGIDCGPLITMKAKQKVQSLLDDALSKGARLVCGEAQSGAGSEGCFFTPAVVSDIDDSMDIFHQEIFGPVATIVPFSDENNAVSMANKTPYGLAAYVYTQAYDRIWRMGEHLDYGMIGVNESAISNEMMPFGGVKQSGHGREGSKYGLNDYLDIKTITLGV